MCNVDIFKAVINCLIRKTLSFSLFQIKNFMEVAVTVALLIAAIILFWILLLNYITLAMPSISLIIVLVHASVHGVALNGGKKERSVVFDAIYYIAELEISKIVKARGKYILLIFFQRR